MRFQGTVITGILLALVFGIVSNAVDSPETLRKLERRRRVQRTEARERAERLLDARKLPYADDLTSDAKGIPHGSVMDDLPRAASRFSTLDLDTLDSPGLMLGTTTFDQQHLASGSHQVARDPGADCVHFTWKYSVGDPGHILHSETYAVYKPLGFIPCMPFPGCPTTIVSFPALYGRPGYTRIDVGSGNRARLVFHQRPDESAEYQTWHLDFPSECSDLNLPAALGNGGLGALLWPDVAVTQNMSGDIRHVIAHHSNDYPRDLLVYWRYDESTAGPWAGPAILDSTDIRGHVIDAADNSDKVAVVYHSSWAHDGLNEMRNVVYRESRTGGLGWIDGTELGEGAKTMISTYGDPLGPEAWVHISVAYDHQSVLHVVWDEQRISRETEDITIRHWNDARGTVRPVAFGHYPNTGISTYNLNLAKVTLGIGDGSTACQGGTVTNEDYLYVLYTKFCGETPEEAADVSSWRGAYSYCNGELYLTASNSGGYSWSQPQNLTNTKTPGCNADSPYDNLCASEHWATIGRDVSDIDIFYIRDFDAGAYPMSEGDFTTNRAMYLRLPGGTVDAPYLCPGCICDCHADPNCDGVMDVLDVVHTVNDAFRQGGPIYDANPLCPVVTTDLDCNGVNDVFDVVHAVNVVFRDGDPEMEYCEPCTP